MPPPRGAGRRGRPRRRPAGSRPPRPRGRRRRLGDAGARAVTLGGAHPMVAPRLFVVIQRGSIHFRGCKGARGRRE
jgi:hypothetical protein